MLSRSSASISPPSLPVTNTRSGLSAAIASTFGENASSFVGKFFAAAGKSDCLSTAASSDCAPSAYRISVAPGDSDTNRLGAAVSVSDFPSLRCSVTGNAATLWRCARSRRCRRCARARRSLRRGARPAAARRDHRPARDHRHQRAHTPGEPPQPPSAVCCLLSVVGGPFAVCCLLFAVACPQRRPTEHCPSSAPRSLASARPLLRQTSRPREGSRTDRAAKENPCHEGQGPDVRQARARAFSSKACDRWGRSAWLPASCPKAEAGYSCGTAPASHRLRRIPTRSSVVMPEHTHADDRGSRRPVAGKPGPTRDPRGRKCHVRTPSSSVKRILPHDRDPASF